MRKLREGEFAARLMAWYANNKREFPWRVGAHDEWTAYLTAFLLRKTKAETVAKHYKRLVSALPNPQAAIELGVEGLQELLKPLGLYRVRAKQLYGLAVALTEGKLDRLPGVGPYTEALVRCLSKGELVPVVDVNVVRVIGRVFGVKNFREVWEIMKREVEAAGSCELNLAVMDFAALVCKPHRPACQRCPLTDKCTFRQKTS